MAFITVDNTVISFADFQDVVNTDQRVFDSNEGLTDDVIETALERATERILVRLRSSEWWQSYWLKRNNSAFRSAADIPPLDPNRIQARHSDFQELCVAWALAEYILPQVANFGDEEDSERAKMGWYSNRKESLFGELITQGDWYDFDNDGEITSQEKSPGRYNLKRVR